MIFEKGVTWITLYTIDRVFVIVEFALKTHCKRTKYALVFQREFPKANQSLLSILVELQCNAVTCLQINNSSIATKFNVQFALKRIVEQQTKKVQVARPAACKSMIILSVKPRNQ